MRLNSDNIRNMIRNIRLVAPSEETYDGEFKDFLDNRTEFIEGAGFDITVSRIFVSTSIRPPFIGSEQRNLCDFRDISLIDSVSEDCRCDLYDADDVYHLPKGFYLLQSYESVTLPTYYGATIYPRTSFFNSECLIGCSRIAPGFSGQLRCGLLVTGANGLDLQIGARFATVMFYQFVNGKCDNYAGVWSGSKVTTNGTERGY